MNAEYVVAKADELKDGQMKQVEAGEFSVLLVRMEGKYSALWATCPHHGAPLAEGLLHEGHVRCPWHQAVFDARTGELLEPPALDMLPHFEVHVKGSDVLVTVPDVLPESCVPPMAKPDPKADGRNFVILGSGAAGMVAAETLRQAGFQGKVTVLTREPHLPYDRTDLSKTYLSKADAERPFIRSSEFYRDHGIEILTGREVAQVDVAAKAITCADGSNLSYDRLLLASGSVPRRLGVQGEDLENVLPLRSLDDCERIRGLAEKTRRAVVVGGSFIGMEVAASLRRRKLAVTVVAPESVPFERVFGPEIGRMYQAVHEKKGVGFKLGAKVKRFEGDGGIRAVLLESGERLETELVVVGVGVRPAAGMLKGIPTNEDGSVTVDSRLRVGEDVWAAGDIARFPDWRTGEPIRIEHWRLALQHGRVAAWNMAGREVECRGVPFFWTNQFMVITQYAGHARQWDEVVYDGDPGQRRFLAYYVKDGGVLAAAGCQEERKMAMISELLKSPAAPKLEQIRRAVSQLAPAGAS